mmetsp:Transcript_52270/g.136560  ORF Transcript_52270/g.136560 Transcript_52270/m.136560 type:complete len:263 (-) Transcript_52270:834-1622(-)
MPHKLLSFHQRAGLRTKCPEVASHGCRPVRAGSFRHEKQASLHAHNIGRLDISVNDAQVVERFERRAHVQANLDRLRLVQRSLRTQDSVHRAPLNELHHTPVNLQVVGAAGLDVGDDELLLHQLAEEQALAVQPPQLLLRQQRPLRVHQLDGPPRRARFIAHLPSLQHDAKSSAAQHLNRLVFPPEGVREVPLRRAGSRRRADQAAGVAGPAMHQAVPLEANKEHDDRRHHRGNDDPADNFRGGSASTCNVVLPRRALAAIA